MVLSVRSGHSSRYLTEAVAKGRENYYTGAVAEGEPPGRWYGKGAAKHGLSGLVDAQDMEALYERFVDPADPGFKDPSKWDEASKLGHEGLNLRSAGQIYRELLDAEPNADAARREELRVQASKQERHNVPFIDVTYNVQKSVTVLHTAVEYMAEKARRAGNTDEAQAWDVFTKAIEDAIWAGNKAALDFMQAHGGYTRIGSHKGNGGRWADAHEWTIASFFQHDNRNHDPHLHIHNGVHNRVQGPDGQWITLDSKAMNAVKPAAGALADRVTQERLMATIGTMMRMRPDGKAREVVGIPQEVMDLFSSRRRAITPKVRELAAEYEARHGRPPNALHMFYLSQQATLATRKAKSHTGKTREQTLDGWENQLRKLIAGGLGKVAKDALDARPAELVPDTWKASEVIDTALAAISEKRSSFTESDLIAEISNALPDYLGINDPQQLADLLTGLKDQAMEKVVPLDAARPGDEVLPDAFRLANGNSAFDAPGRKRYTTREHLHIEHLLREATAKRDARLALSTEGVARFMKSLKQMGIELGADQEAAVEGILTSGARVESLVGPAGTGKSFVVGVLTKAWQDPSLWQPAGADRAGGGAPGGGRARRVVGLAISQVAADGLTAEGVNSANTSHWLAAQNRLSQGRGKPEDQQWELRPGDLVVVDESSMADMQSFHAIRERVEAVGAKMLPTGDYRQCGAVGAAGGMQMMAEVGNAYELTEARRFNHPWERAASLRLRAHDPAVFADYHKNGRIIDSGTEERAEYDAAQAWLADTIGGKHAVLMVDTNEQADRINGHLRAEAVKLGLVAEQGGLFLGHDGNWAGVGDLVRGRRLAWDLVGHEGNKGPAKTSKQYRVLETREDGSMLVAAIEQTCGSKGGEKHGQRLVLPAEYVAKDLALGYALTENSTQGVTADVGYQIARPSTQASALYPGATRGREANSIFVVTQSAGGMDAETGDTAHAPRRHPKAILEEILERARPDLSASDIAAEDAADAANVQTPVDRLRATCDVAVAERTGRWLDELVSAGHMTEPERQRLAAEHGDRKLSPLLRRLELAGHDARKVLAAAVSGKSLAGAREISSVIHGRITKRGLDLDPRGDSFADWIPATGDDQYDRYLTSLAEAADQRRAELGEQTAKDAPEWALAAFGPVPADPEQRAEWVARAGQVAVYREQMNHDDPAEPIGLPPALGLVEPYAAWRSAWRALGRPDTITDEQQMSDARLRVRVRAYEREQAWAPPDVTNKLAGTIQSADRHRQAATLRAAEAAATSDPEQRAKLEKEARGHAELARMREGELPTLRELDRTHQEWVTHTANTRAAAERADAERINRATSATDAEPRVTAEEWLQAHEQAMAAEDPHRDITETDLTDPDTDARAVDRDRHHQDGRAVVVGPDEDVRERAVREPLTVDEDEVSEFSSVDETQNAVDAARRAVAELQYRRVVDGARAAEERERAEQLGRSHTSDHAADRDHGRYDDAGAEL